MTLLPSRHDVFGCGITLTNVEEVVTHILEPKKTGFTVAIANVHTVMTSRREPWLAEVIAETDIATPDGVPLVWALRANGLEAVRVTGIDVMTRALDIGRSLGTKHFFYGSTEPVLEAIVTEVAKRYPGVSIAGTLSPPFREPTESDLDDAVRAITASGANVVWVGLGMPKQERWMGNMRNRLPGVALIGVGAAFDWLAGTVPMAPQWMRDRGLEWLFRLVLEPRRLWKRYIYNNPAFLVLLIGRWLKTGARRVLKTTSSG